MPSGSTYRAYARVRRFAIGMRRDTYSRLQSWLREDGIPGRRYTPREVARILNVSHLTVMGWIDKGWLRASRNVNGGYRMRKRAIRRLFADHVSTWGIVHKAQLRRIREERAAIHGEHQASPETSALPQSAATRSGEE